MPPAVSEPTEASPKPVYLIPKDCAVTVPPPNTGLPLIVIFGEKFSSENYLPNDALFSAFCKKTKSIINTFCKKSKPMVKFLMFKIL